MSGFQIKDFASIVAAEVNHARAVTNKITDFLPGSVARTIIEAPAVEIEELYLQFFLGLRSAIPVATFLSFGFDLLPAKRAYGWASVSSATPVAQDILIPIGTEFTTDTGIRYTSTDFATWSAGTTMVRVPVKADIAGVSGNVAAGEITACPLFPETSGFVVGNALISTGRDAEREEEREARFAEFVRSLSRGTIEACLYAVGQSVVMDADGVIDEYVVRRGYEEQPGWVRIWVFSNRHEVSADLLTVCQQTIDGYRRDDGTVVPGYRAGGVRVDVLPMVEREVPLSIRVGMRPGFTLTPAVEQSLSELFSSEIRAVPSGGVLLMDDLVTSLLTATGVETVVPASTSNILCGVNEALFPGSLSIQPL